MVIGSEFNIVYDSIQKHNILGLENMFHLNTSEKSSFKFKIISKCLVLTYPKYYFS